MAKRDEASDALLVAIKALAATAGQTDGILPEHSRDYAEAAKALAEAWSAVGIKGRQSGTVL